MSVHKLIQKLMLLKKTQIPTELVKIITVILLDKTIANAGSVENRLVNLGYEHVSKLHVIVTALTRLYLGETQSVRLNGLTSFDRKAIYSYRDFYGGIAVMKLPRSNPMYCLSSICKWCDGELTFGYDMCRECEGSGVKYHRDREDVRITISI